MKRIIKILLLLFFIPVFVSANNLSINGVSWDSNTERVTFTVSWDHCFYYNSSWRDFAWVFIKYKNGNSNQWNHLFLDQIINDGSFDGLIRDSGTSTDLPDGFGMMLKHTESGTVSGTIVVEVLPGQNLYTPSFKVFGIEMVKVASSQGKSFYVGDGISSNRFHKGDDSNQPFYVNGTAISIGTGPNDMSVKGGMIGGTYIPSAYPRNPFNCMKYEISQQQYVEFLNTLTRNQQNNRVEVDISSISVTTPYVMTSSASPMGRNGIRCHLTLPASGAINFYCDLNANGSGNETNDGQSIACNYLLPDDLMAYLDWAGMRPMSEFEYEFLCRGTDLPIGGEFAWGTTDKTSASLSGSQGGPDEVPTNLNSPGLVRIIGSGPIRCGFGASTNTTRLQAGASFYGIMELTGNLTEMVAGISTEEELLFDKLDSGDGVLDFNGDANEFTWPANLTFRGKGTSLLSLQKVSQRNTLFQSQVTRSASVGGRGIPNFNGS